ncbi:MAG: hypothetical protein RLZZ301_542 [Bacteroidota bacterium]|jgi:hypothetical protein
MFQVGEAVSLLYEAGQFRILAQDGTVYLVEDEHGFTQRVEASLIVARKPIVLHDRIPIKEAHVKSNATLPAAAIIARLDLHAEQLNLPAGLSAHQILSTQIDVFKRFFNQQLSQRSPRFELVHGVGEGRLKQEIRSLVQGKIGVQMHDANWANGAVGASIIEIKWTLATRF